MATAQTSRVWTREAWVERSEQLAAQHHLTGTARYLDPDTYAVPSRDRRTQHFVTVTRSGLPACDCVAGSFHKPCAHSGAVIHAERIRELAISKGSDDPFATFRTTGEW